MESTARLRQPATSTSTSTSFTATLCRSAFILPRPGKLPKQAPFAIVVGCSDARVPMEMLFGQGFNNLFVVRVAGNVLGDVCVGSVEYALHSLSDSVKCVVMLGHMGCGAVTAAVDCYLRPDQFWAQAISPMLRKHHSSDLRRGPRVRTTRSSGVWGPDARDQPGYREALIDVAVCVNAAHAAYDLRLDVERAKKSNIKVLYGVFSLRNNQVSMPTLLTPMALSWRPVQVNPSPMHAPTDPKEFKTLAFGMAEILKAGAPRRSHDGHNHASGVAQSPKAVASPRKSDDLLGLEMPFRPL